MERISEFCNENKQIIFIGGVTIVCLVSVKKMFFSGEEEEKKLKVVNGDVLNYTLYHVKAGYDAVYFSGMPTGFNFQSLKSIYDLIFRLIFRLESHKVEILNARTRDLNFNECGFCILPYKENFNPKEWHLKENQEKFWEDMTPLILEKFPGAKVNEWYSCLFRGGEGQNPPAIDGAHLDNFPDFKRSAEFRGDVEDKYSKEQDPEKKMELKGANKFAMIGVWKPIDMKNPVLDHPLALMDKSTFRPKTDSVEFRQEMTHFEGGEKVWFKNLGGHIRYHEDQTWYYYPEMTDDEVIIFVHLSSGDARACPHSSFRHPDAPEDADSFQNRQSVEGRCMLVWPNEVEEKN